MDLILLICLIAAPENCREERVRFSVEVMAPMACLSRAPSLIAQWSSPRPDWRVTRWRCGVPGADGYRI